MKNRSGIIVLLVIALGLLVTLVVTQSQAGKQIKDDRDRILKLSNDFVHTIDVLEEQRRVNAALETDLDKEKKSFVALTNNFAQVSANLSRTSTELARTESALKASQEEVVKRDAKIADLEAQNQALDKQALDLSTAITNLTSQIATTEKKLAASEGDKAFLEKELRHLMAEKAELERQFNDLNVLRAQVAKLKEELNIARRLEWIRQGLFASSDQKGAQQLMQGLTAPQAQPKTPKPVYDLNVEVKADGSVKVIPPPTNRPAAKPPQVK